MHVTYEEEGDILAVDFGERTERTGSRDFGGGRFVEFNSNGDPIGVEFLSASRGIDLTDIPRGDEIHDTLHRLGAMLDSKVQSPA
ncbi:MAG: DUF2283 domain-containing protein [Dehalococcoidia bacterium]